MLLYKLTSASTTTTGNTSCNMKCDKGMVPDSQCEICTCVTKQYTFRVTDFSQRPLPLTGL